jgi:hypothetical protein
LLRGVLLLAILFQDIAEHARALRQAQEVAEFFHAFSVFGKFSKLIPKDIVKAAESAAKIDLGRRTVIADHFFPFFHLFFGSSQTETARLAALLLLRPRPTAACLRSMTDSTCPSRRARATRKRF